MTPDQSRACNKDTESPLVPALPYLVGKEHQCGRMPSPIICALQREAVSYMVSVNPEKGEPTKKEDPVPEVFKVSEVNSDLVDKPDPSPGRKR